MHVTVEPLLSLCITSMKRRMPFLAQVHWRCPGLPNARLQVWGPRWVRRSIWQRPHIPEALTYVIHYVSF